MALQLGQDDLIRIKDQAEAWLLNLQGVIGSGVGLDPGGHLAIKVFTHGITPEVRSQITSKLGQVPIVWEEGEIQPS